MTKEESEIVCDAYDATENLTDWENEFIESLITKPEGYTLSELQREQLLQIQDKL